MNDWRFIPLETKNGYWNMALDEAILESVIQKRSPFTIRLYKWSPSTITIGRNQSLHNEVNLKFCQREKFDVIRRITGGGAVFHDNKGEITYSIICSLDFLKKRKALTIIEQYEIITDCITVCLKNLGLKTNKGIIHCPALFFNNKKFSGNAQLRKKGIILQHGTILLDINPELMYFALKPPQNSSHNRMVKSVRTKCIGIKNSIPNYKEQYFVDSLKQSFMNQLDISLLNGTIVQREREYAKKLIEEKYKNKKWLEKYD
ncbi:MAG: lipoate--protein ligase family protein [Candidatus Lokiarchaeota archaeon]|nr:lipoate--protein ligase family protein [Candidatus Lokiarchaeota archaeon]